MRPAKQQRPQRNISDFFIRFILLRLCSDTPLGTGSLYHAMRRHRSIREHGKFPPFHFVTSKSVKNQLTAKYILSLLDYQLTSKLQVAAYNARAENQVRSRSVITAFHAAHAQTEG